MVLVRKTKDGAFLREMEGRRLIRREDLPLSEASRDGEPEEFRAWWSITPLGLIAAEYGLYNARPDEGWPADDDQSEVTSLA